MADFVRRSGRKTTKLTDLSESGSGPNSPGMEVFVTQFPLLKMLNTHTGAILGREKESEKETEGVEKPSRQRR